jgi:hypothetical protein
VSYVSPFFLVVAASVSLCGEQNQDNTILHNDRVKTAKLDEYIISIFSAVALPLE